MYCTYKKPFCFKLTAQEMMPQPAAMAAVEQFFYTEKNALKVYSQIFATLLTPKIQKLNTKLSNVTNK